MENINNINKKMEDDAGSVPKDLGVSQIQQMFVGKTIFLTGATGFLGKSLVEKILRSCPEIEKMYLLLRPAKHKSVEERMETYFQHAIFNNVRNISAKFYSKVVPIKGDLQDPKLGISEEDYNKLINEVHIMYHNGGEVKFNVKIAIALKINVLGTKEMLELAMKCKNIQAFVYVSTAYSHSYQTEMNEKFYPAPGNIKMVEDIVKAHEENAAGLNDDAVPGIIGHWPNVYTFTKAVAEDLVRQYGQRATFGMAIFRPSIVIPTFKEPVPGWCGNLNGPVAAWLAMALGLFRIGYTRDENFDIVPVDMCSNMGLAITWDIIKHKNKEQKALVFNYGSSVANPMTLKGLYKMSKPYYRDEPTLMSYWYPNVIITKCFPLFVMGHIFMHFIPLVLFDIYSMFRGKFPDKTLQFIKFHKLMHVWIYYATTGFRIDVTETSKVCDKMSDADKKIFFCDIRSLPWEEYVINLWRGLRIFILKDPMSTVDAARQYHKKLRVMHWILQGLIYLFVYYMLSGYIHAVLNMFWS